MGWWWWSAATRMPTDEAARLVAVAGAARHGQRVLQIAMECVAAASRQMPPHQTAGQLRAELAA